MSGPRATSIAATELHFNLRLVLEDAIAMRLVFPDVRHPTLRILIRDIL